MATKKATMTNYIAVLDANYAGSEWSISENDYSTLEWFSATTKPTQAELDAQWPTVEYNDQYAQVETTRRTQYEAQSDGLFFEWQRGTNTQAAWESAVQAVKDANPYPPNPAG
jgi:hypothetical protein